MPTATAQVTISNRLGLHARPAMALVDLANGFSADVKLRKDTQTVDAKSIMQIMMLAATKGTVLTVSAEGPDADAAVQAVVSLVESKFDEE